LLLVAASCSLLASGGCEQIIGLGTDYSLCNPVTGAGGCGGASDGGDSGPAADADAAG
jgi:hypothetical protein